MPERLRAAIVGCGTAASENDLGRSCEQWSVLTHAGAYRCRDEVVLVAAADIDPVRLARFGKAWQVDALYVDYREMLRRERIDVLSVCVPDQMHAEVVLEACQAGVRALFCEKPIATTLDDGRRMLEACERTRTVLAVNYFRRWNATLRRLRTDLRDGTYGEVLRVNAWYPGGVLHNGTHAFDLVRWLLGEIRQVCALGCRWTDPKDPTMDVMCVTESGVSCFFHGCDPGIVNLFEVDMLTSAGRIRIAENGRRLEHQAIVQDPVYRQYRLLASDPEVTPTEWQSCFSAAVADVLECLETGASPSCTGQDAYRAMEIAVAACTSEENGRSPVDMMRAFVTSPMHAGNCGGGL